MSKINTTNAPLRENKAPNGRLRSRIVLAWFCFIWALHSCLLPDQAGAAVPVNDVCSGAEEIPATAGSAGPYLTAVTDITDATDAGDPDNACNSFVSRGIWYKFTPERSAIYTISSCPDVSATTVSDTIMAIYNSSGGCAGPFDEVSCADDDSCTPGDTHAALSLLLTADTTYYVAVWEWGTNRPPPGLSEIQLQVTRTVPPPNDTCATALPIFLNVPVQGSTIGATNNYQLAGVPAEFPGIGQTPSAASGRDVVFSFAAPASGEYSFKAINYDLDHDLVLYVASNCPSGPYPAIVTGSLAAANRTTVGLPEEVMCLPLSQDQLVYIFVDETDPTGGVTFTLEVAACVRETVSNDSPTNASPFVCGIEASISPRDDVDFFALGTFPAGSRAFVMVDGSAAKSGADFDLRLTTATDTLEYDAADNDPLFGDLTPNLAGTPLPDTPVFVEVSGTVGEPYHLYAVVQPGWARAIPESEPNDTLEAAGYSDANYFRGSLTNFGSGPDVDLFRFVAGEGDLVFVSLDCDPHRDNTPIDGQLKLLDAAGNVLLAVDDSGNASSTNRSFSSNNLGAYQPYSPGEALVYRILAEGFYYVGVSMNTNNGASAGAADYLLSISRNCSWSLAAEPRFLSISHTLDNHMRLQLRGTPAATYRVFVSSDLASWTPLPDGTRTADGNGYFEVEDTNLASSSHRFYRATWP